MSLALWNQHKTHRLDISEGARIYYGYEVGDDDTLSLYDYSTGDGDSDYHVDCLDCSGASFSLPSELEVDYT